MDENLEEQLAAAISRVSIAGKEVCITGVLSSPRHEIEREIVLHGGIPKHGVTKSVQLLIVGDKPGGTKVGKAVKYGIPVITESEMWSLMEGV
jgi:DNA ligase (NAD+)